MRMTDVAMNMIVYHSLSRIFENRIDAEKSTQAYFITADGGQKNTSLPWTSDRRKGDNTI